MLSQLNPASYSQILWPPLLCTLCKSKAFGQETVPDSLLQTSSRSWSLDHPDSPVGQDSKFSPFSFNPEVPLLLRKHLHLTSKLLTASYLFSKRWWIYWGAVECLGVIELRGRGARVSHFSLPFPSPSNHRALHTSAKNAKTHNMKMTWNGVERCEQIFKV